MNIIAHFKSAINKHVWRTVASKVHDTCTHKTIVAWGRGGVTHRLQPLYRSTLVYTSGHEMNYGKFGVQHIFCILCTLECHINGINLSIPRGKTCAWLRPGQTVDGEPCGGVAGGEGQRTNYTTGYKGRTSANWNAN